MWVGRVKVCVWGVCMCGGGGAACKLVVSWMCVCGEGGWGVCVGVCGGVGLRVSLLLVGYMSGLVFRMK